MSLHPTTIEPVLELTARVARAAFPKGNPYLLLREELGILFQDALFAPLFPPRGRPVVAPWRLALVTGTLRVIQFAEDLSDLQAAEAVRSRIDWKYALSLELEDPGFDACVLCEFRARLLVGNAEALFLDTLLKECRKRGLLKAGGKQCTDSTHMLGAVRALNRYELVVETSVRFWMIWRWRLPIGCGLTRLPSGRTATSDSEPSNITMRISTIAYSSCCPECGQTSGRIHSHYQRTLTDLTSTREGLTHSRILDGCLNQQTHPMRPYRL